MRRAPSFTDPDQGGEETCSAHAISRLFVHNIVQPDICPLEYKGRVVPPAEEITSDCSFLLKTEGGKPRLNNLNPHTCGGIRKYFSTLMYLYSYYSILEENPDIVCTGGFDSENFLILQNCVYGQTIPKIFDGRTECIEDIQTILDIVPSLHFSKFYIVMPPKLAHSEMEFNGIEGYRADLFMKLCTQNNLYIGATIRKKRNDGHSMVISDYDPAERTITFKNSWGNEEDVIPIHAFRGPHYTLGKKFTDYVMKESDEYDVKLNAPIRFLFYLGPKPIQQLYTEAGLRFYDPSPVKLRKVTRSSARRVGSTRTSHIRSSASSTQTRRSRA